MLSGGTPPPVSWSCQSRFDTSDSSDPDDAIRVQVKIQRQPPPGVDLKSYAESGKKPPTPSRWKRIMCRWVLPILCVGILGAGIALGVLVYQALLSEPGYALCGVSLCGGLGLEECAVMLKSNAEEGQEVEADLTVMLENPTAFPAVLTTMSGQYILDSSNETILGCELVDSKVHLPPRSWAPLNIHCVAVWDGNTASFLYEVLTGNTGGETLRVEYVLRVLGISYPAVEDLSVTLSGDLSSTGGNGSGPACPSGSSASGADVLGSTAPSLQICDVGLSAPTQENLDNCVSGFGFVSSFVNKILPGNPLNSGACEEVLNTMQIIVEVMVDNPTAFTAHIDDLNLQLTRVSDGFGLGTGFINEPVDIAPHAVTQANVLFDLSGILQYDVDGPTLQMVTEAAANQLSAQLEGRLIVSVLGATFPAITVPALEVDIPVGNPLAGGSSTGAAQCTTVPLSVRVL